jgi:hypothetical protein
MSARGAGGLGLGMAVALATAGSFTFAHTGGSIGYAAIAIDGGSIRYRLTLWPSALPPAVADELELARTGDVHARDRLLGSLRDRVTFAAQGQRCAPRGGSLLPPAPTADSVTLMMEFACADAVRDLIVRDDLSAVFGADYHTLARIDAPGRTEQFAFAPETREARLTLGAAPGGGRGGAWSFVRLGIDHILRGYDHLLFLLGLLLPGGGLLAMAKIVTAFTLAHSMTLSLAVLDLVVLPDRLVEAVIALSIAAVAAENLYLRPTVTRRWILSFGFGLVHGFGFSSALRELGLPSDGLLISLLGFNVGVEAGQLLAAAVGVPVLFVLRARGWGKRMAWGSSMAILVVGLVLFVDRVFL